MLNRIKLRLNLSFQDGTQDALLTELLHGSKDAICLYIESSEFPSPLETTAVMMTVDAYNRLGTEGMKEERKGELTQIFHEGLLDPYQDILDKYLEQSKRQKRGMFI